MRELICGRNSVLDAIANQLPIKVIYTSNPQELKGCGCKVEVRTKRELDELIHENHQGFVAELKEFNYYDIDVISKDNPKIVLILDHLQDPRNLGAILRSANAFGVKHIIIPKDRAAKVTASALKTSSGGYIGLKILRVNSLVDIITKLKEKGYWIYATNFENSKNINDISFNDPMAIIVGNEEKGVSNSLLKQADECFFVKTVGTVQSLNVSVATGIILSKISQ